MYFYFEFIAQRTESWFSVVFKSHQPPNFAQFFGFRSKLLTNKNKNKTKLRCEN